MNHSLIKKINTSLLNKKVSAIEICKFYLENIEKNKGLNCFITENNDNALKQAKKIDEKISKNENFSIIGGVPFSLKDNISTKSLKTTCASKILSDYIPVFNATVVEKLFLNDGVLMGKNNMDEFAMGSLGDNSFFGSTKNPINEKYFCGGSSSGSACCCRKNMSVFSLGSDTGGSVRIPSSFCGLTALKPTYGSISRYGLIAYSSSFDQIGVISGFAQDCEIVFNLIKGKDDFDMTTYLFKELPFKKPKKIGIIKNSLELCEKSVKNNILNAINVFEKSGFEIIYLDFNFFKESLSSYYILALAEASSNLGRFDFIRYGKNTNNNKVDRARNDGFSKEVKKRILFGTALLKSGDYNNIYKNADYIRKNIKYIVSKFFSQVDLLLTSTSPYLVPSISNVNKTVAENYNNDIFVHLANLCSLPAITFPCGVDKNNMPSGVQIMANYFCEDQLFFIAKEFEKQTNSEFLFNK